MDRRLLAAISGEGKAPGSETERHRDDLFLRGRTILVVEDESLIALLIQDVLEEAGALVVGPCYTLAECMRAARFEKFDAAILDVNLAGEDVFPAADEIRKRGIPFLFHTAHADRDEIRARFGDIAICRKPVGMDLLLNVLARLAGDATTKLSPSTTRGECRGRGAPG